MNKQKKQHEKAEKKVLQADELKTDMPLSEKDEVKAAEQRIVNQGIKSKDK